MLDKEYLREQKNKHLRNKIKKQMQEKEHRKELNFDRRNYSYLRNSNSGDNND